MKLWVAIGILALTNCNATDQLFALLAICLVLRWSKQTMSAIFYDWDSCSLLSKLDSLPRIIEIKSS